MLLNFIDEVLAGVEKFTLIHEDNTSETVSIQLATAVTTQGTPLNKALFDKIDKYLCPAGIITMWSGATNAVPEGWALCDGNNGTPDLLDRFIVGAGNSYNVGATGGENTHTLSTDEMPEHNHSFIAWNGSQSGGLSKQYLRANVTSGGQVGIESAKCLQSSSTTMIGNTGSTQPHENRPPYYALAYIMKLAN